MKRILSLTTLLLNTVILVSANYETYFMDQNCGGALNLYSTSYQTTLILNATQTYYSTNQVCTVNVYPPSYSGLVLTVNYMNLRDYPKSQPYDGDSLKVTINSTYHQSFIGSSQNNPNPVTLVSSAATGVNYISLRFTVPYGGASTTGKGFQLLFSVYQPLPK